MNLSDHQFEFLKDVAVLIQYAERRGWKLTGGELWRTAEQQKIYFERKMTRTMNSLHLRRLAIDFNLFINDVYQQSSEPYRELGEFWESLNERNRWGGNFENFKDGNHFERRV